MPNVAVYGASGFVGKAVVDALTKRGATVRRLRAPRLVSHPGGLRRRSALADEAERQAELAIGCDSIVNCAGIADAASADDPALFMANGVLPGVLARAAKRVEARLVHVSSAAVQGPKDLLDASDSLQPFSAYSRSKAAGELSVAHTGGRTVIYRPPGVQDASRQVTLRLARIARSSCAFVAAPGTDPTPQALLGNAADAIAFLALSHAEPPARVLHPWEGLTTGTLLEFLSGRRPRQLPRTLAIRAVKAANEAGRTSAKFSANARRLELLWFGQRQAQSWLTTNAGWEPPVGLDGWTSLGQRIQHQSATRGRER